MLKKIALAVCLAATTLSLPAQFEGVVKVHLEGETDLTITYRIKNHLIHQTVENEQGRVQRILDRKTGDLYQLVDRNGQKIALKSNVNDNAYYQQQRQLKKMDRGKKPHKESAWTLTPTDETREIDGVPCTGYRVAGVNGTGEAWLARELPLDPRTLFTLQGLEVDQSLPLLAEEQSPGFILEATLTSADGKSTQHIRSQITEQEVDENLFTLNPKEWTLLDLSNMAQLMEQARQDPDKMREVQKMLEKMKVGQ
ncbi:MAG: hypothetical protein D6765_05240 [Bacteroidetes bacterium]|nr:MAG: hypothetical protein D6765_05240 [Bacteroidota bacterium]